MFVAHCSFHDVEDLIDRSELDKSIMLFEVSADKKLSEWVHRPNIFVCWVELYEVGISEKLLGIFLLQGLVLK